MRIKQCFFVYLLIAFLCFLAYANSLNNPFIWDDDAIIVKNPLIRNWRFWEKAFFSDLYYGTSSGSNFYRPIQTLSYMWDYHLWQLDPRGYHFTNIFLNSLVSFLVFLLTYFLFKETIISFATALLFAVSPIHTEVVAYISGRAEMLMGIFLISSLILFIKSQSYQGKYKIFYLFLSLVSFGLGLLSKELAVVFPLVILAYVFYFARDSLKKTGFLVRSILPFFITANLYLVLRLSLLKFVTLRPPALTKFPLLLRITVLPKVIFTYIKLLILPVNLHMSRELIRPTSFLGFFIAWFLLGTIVVICIYLLRYKEKRKIISFFLSWFLIFLLPQSGIFPINAFVAEHFIYLSSISFFVAVSYLLYRYLKKQLFGFSLICLLLFYMALTYSRNVEWSDPVIFFERIIKFSPASFQAHNNLGLEYEKRNEFEEAISHYQKALELIPDLLEAHSNLASVYFKMGNFKDAEREYLIVERTAPGSKAGEIQNNIGALYEMQGLFDKALARYKLALSLNPFLNYTHFNIARIYLARGDFDLATQEITNSLAPVARPVDKNAPYIKIIANFLKEKKNAECAATFYNDLGIEFAKVDFFDEAINSFTKSVELAPEYADAHFNLGLVYWKKGSRRQAIFEFKTTLKMNPNHYQAKGLLSQINKNNLINKIFMLK